MFISFLEELRRAGIAASPKEHLTLLEALDADAIERVPEHFYYLARAIYVKDEGLIDRFDQVFARVFKGVLGDLAESQASLETALPEDWLKAVAEKFLSADEMEKIKALGSWDEIMETLKKRLAEQQGRHQGGSKWIGTGGTSPFGNGGYNPEGVRIGGESRHKRAIKVWEKREFRNFDHTRDLGTRNIKIALRRLRRFAREGAADELDLDATIAGTASKGYLDVAMRPERRNAVKLLLFLDVGGSMDEHVRVCEELFSAATAEFKHLEFFYFHNCVYEGVWKDNSRRHARADPHLRRAASLRARLQASVRRRRADEPLRGEPSGRLGRAYEPRARRRVAHPFDRGLPRRRLAQSGRGGGLALLAIDRDDPRTAGRPHVSDDARGPGPCRAHTRAETLTRPPEGECLWSG